MLTGVILLGVAATFGATKLLSETLLKGMPSSFVLELPPYRRPQIAKVIIDQYGDVYPELCSTERCLFWAGPPPWQRRRGRCCG